MGKAAKGIGALVVLALGVGAGLAASAPGQRSESQPAQ